MKPRTFAVTLVSIAIAGAAAVLHTALRGPDPIRTVHIGAAVAERAADAGVAICVNTDAHGVDTLTNMRWGIATARRGCSARSGATTFTMRCTPR